jgi:formate dehydrogenase alpha subunit
MIIRTEGDDLFQDRKKAVEKHLSVHPLDCPVCDADGHCELQDMSFQHGVTTLANAKQKLIPEDTRSLVLDFNMNRCIACGECINICKDVQMIDALQFMKKGGFNQVVAKGDAPLACEFCGDCLAVCPVGAITNKFSKYLYKPWQLKKTTTICNYCGDGCQMHVETKDNEVVRVTSPLSWKNKWGDRSETAKGHGGLCVRGRFGFQFIDSKARLTQPLVRKGAKLTESPWIETIETVTGRLADIKAKYGPNAIAGLITARCSNEELYLFQKLMRAAIGTNQLDSSARYGHLNFIHAVRHALGAARMTNDTPDITKAKAILVVGSNVTETNPVFSLRVKEAIRVYQSQVIVVDSANTNLAKLASHPMLVRPGTEGLFVKGLVKSAIERDLIDTDVTGRHPQAFAALKQAVEGLSLDAVASATGVSKERIAEAATVFVEAPRSVVICGEGVVRRHDGYRHVLALIDLLWVTGKLGRPGCGINTVTEEANEQGAVDMGTSPEFLPGQVPSDHDEMRAKFSRAWSAPMPNKGTGAGLMDILKKCRNGEIKALYLIGENPLGTLPASAEVKAALEKLELLIVQDPFMTESAQLAHIVLPACTFAEKEGTMTSQDGKVQRIRQTMDPIGESLPDWQILAAVGSGLGCASMEYESAQDIQREIMKLLPGYYNLGQPKKVTVNPDGYLSNGYRAEVTGRYASPHASRLTPHAGSLTLTMGQLLYHSGKLSTQASGLLLIEPATGKLHMSLSDMERMGLTDGDRVRVSSAKGTAVLSARADVSMLPDSCFYPEHFNNPPVKDLMAVEVDAATGVPYFKQTAVSIEKA